MLFKYSGIVKSKGKKIKSSIEAPSLEEAKSKLLAKGIVYTEIKEDSFGDIFKKFTLNKKRHKIDAITLSTISRDLSIYLSSGISLFGAIKLIGSVYRDDKKLGPFFSSLITHLDEGKSFANALELQTVITLPEFYKKSIKVSESGGLLSSVLLELATYLKEQHAIKKQVGSAMAYPIFILIVSVLMVGFMLSFIVPKITSIFEQYDQELPSITQVVINLGDFFSSNYHLLLIGFIVLLISLSTIYKRVYKFRYMIHKFFLKLPFFSSLIESSELSRFCYMNSVLIRSGMPVIQSFKLSSEILKNELLKLIFNEASAKVVEGKKLSTLLESNKIYSIDNSFIKAIAIGEETSSLSEILNNLAKLYNESNRDKIGVLLSMLEPMFMLFVGSTIGVIVVAMLLPIFSMNFG
jgi:type IV pilus assembly protein PilC